MDSLERGRETLLRALGQIDQAAQELGQDATCYVTVVYSVCSRPDGLDASHERAGWCSTSEPTWATVALLDRAAERIAECGVRPADE